KAQLILENCVAVGGHNGVSFQRGAERGEQCDLSIRLARNTLAQHMAVSYGFDGLSDLSGPKAGIKPYRLEVTANVLDGRGGAFFLLYWPAVKDGAKPLPRADAEIALRARVSWAEQRNAYAAGGDFLKMALKSGGHEAGSSKSLNDWQRFWGL